MHSFSIYSVALALSCFALSGCTEEQSVPQKAETTSILPLGESLPSAQTLAKHAQVQKNAPFADNEDFARAQKGFLGTRAEPKILTQDGDLVWDLNAYSSLDTAAPNTVHPSLWRQAQLLSIHGLFEVAEGVYQVRGFDLANISFVKGDLGWIVIDPLTSEETARAAFDLLTDKLGTFPISAIIYTHSHGDHFGGAGGLLEFMSDDAPIIAPKHFLEETISENILVGVAMRRRAKYHVGDPLEKSPLGTVSSGLGMSLSRGTYGIVPPTHAIETTGQEMVVDGVKMVFQITSGTEAPAELNVNFPTYGVVNIAENANPTQHNILTPRGAKVRDAKQWAKALTEAIDMFGNSDALMVSHGWPRFGSEEITDYLSKQRDAYAFLHDQTVRMMNLGMTGPEIADQIELPETLRSEWYNRPYYGSLSFNARAIYQHYLGWFDGNPVHLAPLPPEKAARRYVQAMGGSENVIRMARTAFDEGDYTWAAEILNHVVFADATDDDARDLLARAYDQLGWQSENALWRNFYLTGAMELRDGVAALPENDGAKLMAVVPSLPTSSLFDVVATQLNPERSAGKELRIAMIFPDRNEEIEIQVKNSVLTHRSKLTGKELDATLTIDRRAFLAGLLGGESIVLKIMSGEAQMDGDPFAFSEFASWIDQPDPSFRIVAP